MEKIIHATRVTSADAIHPGYGFLSENEDFISKVEKEGIIFIGPRSNVVRQMGDKVAARMLAKSLGIPIVPGVTSSIKSLSELHTAAEEIGFPLLLKAVAGGGGKGMRIVNSLGELDQAYETVQSEARAAFGDDRAYVEKYITNPRHIEVQILADTLGNVVHLGERECSIQRRHQKIVEESPSPVINTELRTQLTDAALELIKSTRYVNAGTIEFLVDEQHHFYFLEMNTRIQVEHPITEMRTGKDIVREQILIANGEKLRFNQKDIQFRGHALECRIYAEDPFDSFFPSTGTITYLRGPSGHSVREDRGVDEGDTISPYYDPMISKLISWAESREESLSRLQRALNEYHIYGVKHNISFCLWLLRHPQFISGNYSTNFISEHFRPQEIVFPDEAVNIAAAAAVFFEEKSIFKSMNSFHSVEEGSRWSTSRLTYLR